MELLILSPDISNVILKNKLPSELKTPSSCIKTSDQVENT